MSVFIFLFLISIIAYIIPVLFIRKYIITNKVFPLFNFKKINSKEIFLVIVLPAAIFAVIFGTSHICNDRTKNATKEYLTSPEVVSMIEKDNFNNVYLKAYYWNSEDLNKSSPKMPISQEQFINDLRESSNGTISDEDLAKAIVKNTDEDHIIIPERYIKEKGMADIVRFKKLPLINDIYFSIGDCIGAINVIPLIMLFILYPLTIVYYIGIRKYDIKLFNLKS